MCRRRGRDNVGCEDEEEEEIVYGIQRARDRTTYEHREHCALTPAQMMEQDRYYSAAESWLNYSMKLAEIASGFAVLLAYYQNLSFLEPVSAYITDKISSLETILKTFTFWIMWVMTHVELFLLRAEDLTVFARRRHRFKPHRWRRISEISRDNCYRWFGVYHQDLTKLYSSWRIPNEMRAPRSRHVYIGEECFIIYLFHLMQGIPFTTMARMYFGGDPRRMSEMFEVMVNHIYFTFYNKISGTSLDQWLPSHLDTCRELIHRALSDRAIHETTVVDGEVVGSRGPASSASRAARAAWRSGT